MPQKRKRAKVFLLVVGTLAALVLVAMVRYRDDLIAWYEFRRDFESLPVNAQGLPEYRHRQSGIAFVRVPGGTFLMGSPETEARREQSEGPVHEVQLSAFLIAKYEVTQEQWQKVMGTTPSHFKGQNLPVERVSWDDCQEFCKRTGLSLPTEAQWEYACRAGTRTPFSFGETITTDHVNYNGNDPYGGGAKGKYRQTTVPVDALEPNGFGLHQMHGNVWEWCVDVYDREFYSNRKALEKDPMATSGSTFRVVRGASWAAFAEDCRSASRFDRPTGRRSNSLGFRPAWPPRQPE